MDTVHTAPKILSHLSLTPKSHPSIHLQTSFYRSKNKIPSNLPRHWDKIPYFTTKFPPTFPATEVKFPAWLYCYKFNCLFLQRNGPNYETMRVCNSWDWHRYYNKPNWIVKTPLVPTRCFYFSNLLRCFSFPHFLLNLFSPVDFP